MSKKPQLLTDGLFVEKNNPRVCSQEPTYTLAEEDKEKDGKVYPSMYRLFMECADEYDAAITILGSWKHWLKLKNCKWFWEGWKGYPTHRGAKEWLEEMKLRDLSMAKGAILKQAKKGNATAARTLIDLIKQEESVGGKGRPKKEDIQKEAAKQAEMDKEIKEDIERMNVVALTSRNQHVE